MGRNGERRSWGVEVEVRVEAVRARVMVRGVEMGAGDGG